MSFWSEFAGLFGSKKQEQEPLVTTGTPEPPLGWEFAALTPEEQERISIERAIAERAAARDRSRRRSRVVQCDGMSGSEFPDMFEHSEFPETY